MASKSLKHKWCFGGSLSKIYYYGAQEWNVNWINNTGGGKEISARIFGRFQGVLEMCTFYLVDKVKYLIIFHRLRSKYMRQQMVGISQLVLQTTF